MGSDVFAVAGDGVGKAAVGPCWQAQLRDQSPGDAESVGGAHAQMGLLQNQTLAGGDLVGLGGVQQG